MYEAENYEFVKFLSQMILLASLFPIGHIKEDESIHTKLIRVRAGSSGRSLTLEGGITIDSRVEGPLLSMV